jgi:dolichol-phosphate mannosyltransferase
MDADLQDPPEVVADMLARFRDGYDIVHGVRRTRERESIFKRGTAYVFYRLLKTVVGIDIPVDAGDFRLMSRRVVLTLRALRETSRFVRGIVAWVSFRQTTVLYDPKPRFAARRTIHFADAEVRVRRHRVPSIVPLRAATWLGTLAASSDRRGQLGSLRSPVRPLRSGWATIMMAVSSGRAQLLATGILGSTSAASTKR